MISVNPSVQPALSHPGLSKPATSSSGESFLNKVIDHLDTRIKDGVDLSIPYRGIDLLSDFERRTERAGDGGIRAGLEDIGRERNLKLNWEEHLMPLQAEGFLMSTYYPDGATPCTLTTRAGDRAIETAKAMKGVEIDGWLLAGR